MYAEYTQLQLTLLTLHSWRNLQSVSDLIFSSFVCRSEQLMLTPGSRFASNFDLGNRLYEPMELVKLVLAWFNSSKPS